MRLSLQLYTLRNELEADRRGTLEKVASIGYKFVEAGYYPPKDAGDWKQLVADLGLEVSGIHVGLEALEDDVMSVAQCAATLGAPYVIVPWVGEERRKDWRSLGKDLENIGRKLADLGLPLAYHNHDFELKEGGLTEIFSSADPEYLQAELDLAWIQIGGGDPTRWIETLSGRLPLVHLKDFEPEASPIWRPAGEGVVDWDSVLEACRMHAVDFGVVELDESPGSPFEAIKKSYDFFSARGIQ